MASKFSEFARDTKKLEQASQPNTSKNDSIPAKEKNPDDLEIK